MSLASELRTIFQLVAAPVSGKTHGERLESFYGRQVGYYDEFRKKLLHGREELYRALPRPTGGQWLEIGGGTGANLEFVGSKLGQLGNVRIIDLCPSMIHKAQQRASAQGWKNVDAVIADASCVDLPPADVIVFSYSLTMIPNWFSALERAIEALKPGGVLGIVDFYVSRKYPLPGHACHGWLTRSFWPVWFGFDDVRLSQDHIAYLFDHLQPSYFHESSGKIPYVPLIKVPYYQFIGQKRSAAAR